MDRCLAEKIDRCARWLLNHHISIVPIGREKKPAIKWKQYQESPLAEWSFSGMNMAIITGRVSNIVVVDCDSYEGYVAWLKGRTPTPLRVRSKRGMHFYYRYPKGVERVRNAAGLSIGDAQYDIRGDGGYVLAPPSLLGGHQYQFCVCQGNSRGSWLDPESLPEFDIQWRPEIVTREHNHNREGVRNLQAFISRIFATEGQGGDGETWKVCRLIAEAGVSEMEGMAMLYEWNQTNANPKWSTEDLQRKLAMAFG